LSSDIFTRPTLLLAPGDVLEIELRNDLGPEVDGEGADWPRPAPTSRDVARAAIEASGGGHGHDVARMRLNRILIDGSDEDGLLLQIFTQDTFGPIFFEIIQRKGNQAFGEGNLQALFDSIELDQIRRGVIKVDAH
jgi:hypothetical protein